MTRTLILAALTALALPALAAANDMDILVLDIDDAAKGPPLQTQPKLRFMEVPERLKPRIPIPGPLCLSCPPFEMERPTQILIQQ